MTPIEIMALILAIVSSLKLIVILIKPKAWYDDIVKPIWSKPMLTGLISLILAGITLYYLLQTMTIINIFAVMLFVVFLMAVGFSFYQKEVLDLATKMLKNKAMLKKAWFYILIWIVLVLWVFYALFI
ncbi:MAG: hypothetical protein WC438_04950 [Candidatus Pacearchaeota archaeon]